MAEPVAWRVLLPIGFAAMFVALCLGLAWIEGIGGGLLLHIACMATAWVAVLPAGALIARYTKVTRAQRFPATLDNKTWWRWHQGLQYAGVALSTLGFLAILQVTGGGLGGWHGAIGLVVVLLGWAQLLAGWLRGSKGGPTGPGADPADPATWRGDHFDMTQRRRIFERVHKIGGWIALALAATAVLTGVALLGAPDWLLLIVGLAWLAVTLAAASFVRDGRHVDTYVAIWGPVLRSPLLPPANSAGRTE